jgi:hypothetical protein
VGNGIGSLTSSTLGLTSLSTNSHKKSSYAVPSFFDFLPSCSRVFRLWRKRTLCELEKRVLSCQDPLARREC